MENKNIYSNYTITLIGDSIAKGVATENSKLLKLENCASNIVGKWLGVEIKNLSVYGQTIKRVQEKGIIEKYIQSLDKTKKNVVVFSIGGNDADYDWQEVAESPLEYHPPKTTEKDFEQILTSMIKKLQENNVSVWLTGIPPVHSQLYFENVISKIADPQKVLEFYQGDITNIQRHQELYNFILYNIALKNNCQFIDIRSAFLRARNLEFLYCKDGAHPNKQGHELIARTIIEQIQAYKSSK